MQSINSRAQHRPAQPAPRANSRRLLPAAAALLLLLVAANHSRADTIPFTFTVDGGAALLGPPSPGASVGVVLTATGTFDPFGVPEYSEQGLITFDIFPGGAFAPTSVENSFLASFNGGTDTFTGTHSYLFGAPDSLGSQTIVSNLIVTGGTGMFSGATGSANATGSNSPPPGPNALSPVFYSGSGQISAPGLAAIPEPATILLAGLGLGWVAVLRRRHSVPTS